MVKTALTTAASAAAALLLLASPAEADGMYSKSSPVLQVDAQNYDRLIARSNHTSIVEFYAPWCGHCQNLKPAYEKAAKNLQGLAKVAAVNCDEESNKPFCGSMGVQGFPTLKIVRPSKKPGKPTVEDYQGGRTAKAIVDTVVDKIPNHVKRVTDQNLEEWLQEGNNTAKAVLFSNKGTASALLRALAIDYLGSISFAQIRDKEKKAVELFGITNYPTLLLLPGGDKDALVYDGEMKKDAMTAFLSQVAPPNPDPAPLAAKPKPAKKSSSTDKKKASKDSSSFSAASASHASEEATSQAATATSLTLEEASQPTASPDPNVVTEDTPKPIVLDEAPTIPTLDTEDALQKACLIPKSPTCILLLLPPASETPQDIPLSASTAAQSSLAEIAHKHHKRHSKLFPFYAVPPSDAAAGKLREALGLKGEGEVEMVATNAKRGWWKRFDGVEFGRNVVEDWIDGIRMGEGRRERLPEGLVGEVEEQVVQGEKAGKGEEPLKVVVEEVTEDGAGEHDEL